MLFIETNSSQSRDLVASETEFEMFLARERRRTQRSGRTVVCLTVEASSISAEQIAVLKGTLRTTDFIGWRSRGQALGIVCTEVGEANADDAGAALTVRLKAALGRAFPAGDFHTSRITQEVLGDENADIPMTVGGCL